MVFIGLPEAKLLQFMHQANFLKVTLLVFIAGFSTEIALFSY